MIYFVFKYGNLEMSNLSAIAIALTGVVSVVFFVIASINTDTQGLIDSSVEKFKDDWPVIHRSEAFGIWFLAAFAAVTALFKGCMAICTRLRAVQTPIFVDGCMDGYLAIAWLTCAGLNLSGHGQISDFPRYRSVLNNFHRPDGGSLCRVETWMGECQSFHGLGQWKQQMSLDLIYYIYFTALPQSLILLCCP